MQIKLLKSVLVADADVMPTPRGEVVSMPNEQAKEFIAAGLGEEVTGKAAPEPENKMAAAPANKASKGK
jgi:hypothetical protein